MRYKKWMGLGYGQNCYKVYSSGCDNCGLCFIIIMQYHFDIFLFCLVGTVPWKKNKYVIHEAFGGHDFYINTHLQFGDILWFDDHQIHWRLMVRISLRVQEIPSLSLDGQVCIFFLLVRWLLNLLHYFSGRCFGPRFSVLRVEKLAFQCVMLNRTSGKS